MTNTLDAVSIARIDKLHPKLRTEAAALYGLACCALTGNATIRITQGLRTFPEQAALYAQGRTKPGSIVTNAKPGQSFHNYGLAIDFALLIDKKSISWETGKDFDGDKVADWMEVVRIFKNAGWSWGGDWRTSLDMPHLQQAFGFTWQELLKMHTAGKTDRNGYVLI